MSDSDKRFNFILKTLKAIFLVGLIVLVCILSYVLIFIAKTSSSVKLGVGDLAAILFGAASLALFIFSILIALWAAFFGWQTVQGIVRERVEAGMNKLETSINIKIKLLENELRGRVASVLGHLMGEVSIDPETLKPKDKDRLVEAVHMCEEGYEFLQKVRGPAEFMALNNLVFYSCLSGDQSRPDFLLNMGRLLKEKSQEKKSTNVLLTGCRAILQYSKDPQEKEAVRSILAGLSQSAASTRERKEARAHLASFPAPVSAAVLGSESAKS